MKIKTIVSMCAGLLMLSSCGGTRLSIIEIESAMNASIGKPFVKTKIDRLINETETYSEYETGLSNGCTWSVQVDKKTNLILSWKLTSPRKPCEEGTYTYG